jgi:hypothetical protein
MLLESADMDRIASIVDHFSYSSVFLNLFFLYAERQRAVIHSWVEEGEEIQPLIKNAEGSWKMKFW